MFCDHGHCIHMICARIQIQIKCIQLKLYSCTTWQLHLLWYLDMFVQIYCEAAVPFNNSDESLRRVQLSRLKLLGAVSISCFDLLFEVSLISTAFTHSITQGKKFLWGSKLVTVNGFWNSGMWRQPSCPWLTCSRTGPLSFSCCLSSPPSRSCTCLCPASHSPCGSCPLSSQPWKNIR